MKKIIPIITSMLLASSIQAGEAWRFLVLSDWHSAEKYVQQNQQTPPDWLAPAIEEDVAAVKMMKEKFGGDLIMLPGDSNDGHWDRDSFIQKNFPGSTAEESILQAGQLCYGGMIDAFRKGGYNRLLMAVGDHEVGDNPWPSGSTISYMQPVFRKVFADAFNRDPDGGKLRYTRSVGNAPARPEGTPYEETSYAYRHKNVLFVTVDVFHQESPNKTIGREGSVTGAVTGKHLKWLDRVLAEGRKDPTIDYIFVQGHLPVIYPVRKVNSSGMMMDEGVDCTFWKTLRKHKVDIYFAGEVHANTVTKDPESDLIQVVSRGNFFNNILTVDVHPDRLDLTTFNQTGEKPSKGFYNPYGKLTIEKSGGKKTFRAEGRLAFVNPQGLQLYFPFEKQYKAKELNILEVRSRKIQGIPCDKEFLNKGGFGEQYSLLAKTRGLQPGKFGSGVALDENSRLMVWSMGPVGNGHAVSFAGWIKTADTNHCVLMNTAAIWNKRNKQFFNINLNRGALEVMTSVDDALITSRANLADNQWHHVAVVMPHDLCKLSEVKLYIDGEAQQTELKGSDAPINTDQAVRISFGGWGNSWENFQKMPVQAYTGMLDELALWTRALNDKEINALASGALPANQTLGF